MILPYSNLQLKHQNPGAEHPLTLPVHVICNTSDEEIFNNIRTNARRSGAWVKAAPAHGGIAVLCGSGPSLTDYLETIREWGTAGATIFAMNGAASYLSANGIVPDYQVIIDAREATAQLVGQAKQHLFASQVHPACFEKMPTAQVWHLQVTGIDEVLPDYDDDFVEIGGAASVGNTATCLAYALGYRTLHLYGYDSSHRHGAGHAFSQPMNDGDPCALVTFCGKEYLVSLTMKLQAEKFQDTARSLQGLGCSVSVYGDGLLPAMFNTPQDALTEQQKYERMWAFREYRSVSPGEFAVPTFLSKIQHPQGTVLDIGCGTGRAGIKLKAAGLAPTLIDFTENSRDYEAMVLPFVQHDVTHPFPVSAMYGFCADMMEHIPPEHIDGVLRNILHATMQTFFQINTAPDLCGALINQPLHLTVQPGEWWRARIEQCGGVVLWSQASGYDVQFFVQTTSAREDLE